MGTVAIIVNPAAGKDIRRLVAEASPVSDASKVGTLRRAVIGAMEGGATRVIMSGDRRGLAERAIDRLEASAEIEIMDAPAADSAHSTREAAALCRSRGVGAVVVLGGDGTHRDVAKGWRDAPIVALSTGTNNVFPRPHEATVAGEAAALVATEKVPLAAVAHRAKTIDVQLDDGENDLGLVDVVLTNDRFTAARAVWSPDGVREIVATIAEPGSVGLSAIAAAVAHQDRRAPGAVHVRCDPNAASRVRAPIAPGLYASIGLMSHRHLEAGDSVTLEGPGVLSFDGERDRTLGADRSATATIRVNGPRVIDVGRALAWASGRE